MYVLCVAKVVLGSIFSHNMVGVLQCTGLVRCKDCGAPSKRLTSELKREGPGPNREATERGQKTAIHGPIDSSSCGPWLWEYYRSNMTRVGITLGLCTWLKSVPKIEAASRGDVVV